MRLFIGIKPDSKSCDKLAQLMADLAGNANFKSVRWMDPNNIHMTLHFIGSFPKERLNVLQESLCTIKTPMFEQIVDRYVGFPKWREVHAFGIGGDAAPEILTLHRAVGDVLFGLGVALEDRSFIPHLTLARSKTGIRLLEEERALFPGPAVRLKVSEFHLFESVPSKNGSNYRVLT